jgi:hypothetical protein
MRFLIATLLLASSLGVSTWAGAQAAEQVHRSKDWVWLSAADDGVLYAGTENVAGNLLALYCYANEGKKCVYATKLGATCKKGDRHAAMFNAASGAAPLVLTCGDDNFFGISPFKDIDDAIRNNTAIAIAIPREDGSFTVSRFSLTGSKAAITGMSSTLTRDAPSPQASPQAAFVRL